MTTDVLGELATLDTVAGGHDRNTVVEPGVDATMDVSTRLPHAEHQRCLDGLLAYANRCLLTPGRF